MTHDERGELARAGYEAVDAAAAGRANAGWWSAEAGVYLAEHGDFLGDADFTWCPEGLREADAELLGPVASLTGRRVLEVGCGAAQCSRWLAGHGVDVLGIDVAAGMLARSRELDTATGARVPTVLADARALPLADGSVDDAFTAFGALAFVPDPGRVHAEVARVLRPGGRWVFAVGHPLRWAFADDPAALTVERSYFDRTPYVETDADGRPLYAEFHHTLGDHVRDVHAGGLVLEDLIEPAWPAGHDRTWGGWGPVRGAFVPGTAIFRTRLP